MTTYEHDSVVPNKDSKVTKKVQVEQMFDDIAPKYDKLNRILSFRIDVLWRKRVVQLLSEKKGSRILDIATGTADLAMMLCKIQPKEIIGVDISRQMLDVGEQKIKTARLDHIIKLQKEDSEQLSFADNTFDAATVSFGVRNFENLNKGLGEIRRVLQPGATFIILEFSKVKKFPMKQLYTLYSRFIMPFVGKLISNNKSAYAYLPESARAFPEGEEMCRILQTVGFKNTKCIPLSFGIASIYIAYK